MLLSKAESLYLEAGKHKWNILREASALKAKANEKALEIERLLKVIEDMPKTLMRKILK